MLMRYIMLMGAAAAALWGAVNLGAGNAGMYLVDAGHTSSIGQGNLWLWALGGVAALMTLSLLRFVIFGLPSMMDGWFQQNKSWLYTVIIGGMIYGAFYLM
ncbi:MAG: hypothetical protein ACRECX_01205 [Methyloceanibacter sp.]|uniref:hypothetical protein n=1 Tax=Methyloceanibacter sp. TaxID=1965321 RepID=UPI003D6CEE50